MPGLAPCIACQTGPGDTQVVKALTAAETAYSAHPSKGVSDSNLLAGADATLVALVQVGAYTLPSTSCLALVQSVLRLKSFCQLLLPDHPCRGESVPREIASFTEQCSTASVLSSASVKVCCAREVPGIPFVYMDTGQYNSSWISVWVLVCKGSAAVLTDCMYTVIIVLCLLQGRNNARAVVTGSIAMFSNELFSASMGGPRYAS